jgi:hypothetical protein
MQCASQIQIVWKNSTWTNIPDDISKPNSPSPINFWTQELRKKIRVHILDIKDTSCTAPAWCYDIYDTCITPHVVDLASIGEGIDQEVGLEWDTVGTRYSELRVSEHKGLFLLLEQQTKEALNIYANHFRITPYVNRKINRDIHSKLYVLRYTCKMRNVYSGALHSSTVFWTSYPAA